MKNFEEPIIIDALDCPEGVYLASGTHIVPPTPVQENGWKARAYWSNHDTGTYSVLSIYADHTGNGGNQAALTLEYHGLPRIKSVKFNSGSGDWHMVPWTSGNFIFFNCTRFNGSESVHLKLDMEFEHGGEYTERGKFAFNPNGTGDQELNEITGSVDGVFTLNVR